MVSSTYADIGNQESEDEDHDDVDDEKGCKWELEFQESVYDDTFLRLVTMRDDYKTMGPFKFFCSFASLFLLVALNCALQAMVITRVYKMITLNREDVDSKLFGPPLSSGACYQRAPGVLPPWIPKGVGQGEVTWDCSPLLPMLFSNPEWLDTDKDGFWSNELDGTHEIGESWSKRLQKIGNVTRAFHLFLKEIQENKFLYQQANQLTTAQVKDATKDYTRIPMTWLRAEVPHIVLCNNVDANLCGNLEARNILKTFIPDGWMTPGDRIYKCRKLSDRCDELFGELFHWYTLVAQQQCGEIDTQWRYDKGINVNIYHSEESYNPRNDDSVIYRTYLVFLMLVLIIWWLAVLDEMRQVLNWWFVLVALPSKRNVLQEDERTIIQGVGRLTKLAIAIFILVPRTCIIACLSVIGSDFLISADNYSDLILNSVALAFITDVDEMLFDALVSTEQKKKVKGAEAIVTEHCCFRWCLFIGELPQVFPGFVFVLTVVCSQITYSLYNRRGKVFISIAYDCLCHAAGPNCLAARVLGGLDHVPPEM